MWLTVPLMGAWVAAYIQSGMLWEEHQGQDRTDDWQFFLAIPLMAATATIVFPLAALRGLARRLGIGAGLS